MALTIPDIEPTTVVRNTRWTWRKTLTDFSPADAWALDYRLWSPLHAFEIAGTDDGTRWLIELEPAVTDAVPAGEYRWQARVTHATDGVFVPDVGVLVVVEDLGQVAQGDDLRSFPRRMLDAIEARMAGTADRDDLSYSTEGLSVSRYSPEQLEDRWKFYKSLVVMEERRQRARDGKMHQGRIFTRLA